MPARYSPAEDSARTGRYYPASGPIATYDRDPWADRYRDDRPYGSYGTDDPYREYAAYRPEAPGRAGERPADPYGDFRSDYRTDYRTDYRSGYRTDYRAERPAKGAERATAKSAPTSSRTSKASSKASSKAAAKASAKVQPKPAADEGLMARTPLLVRGTLGVAVVLALAASLVRSGIGVSGEDAQATLLLGQGTGAVQAAAPAAQPAESAPADVPAPVSAGPVKCKVRYSVTSRATDRFTAVVTVTNTGKQAMRGWSLRWSYPSAVQLEEGWNGDVSSDGGSAQIRDLVSGRAVEPGASTTIGFVGVFGTGKAGTDPTKPTNAGFSLNGVKCR
jgi:Cellulose binding domain